MKLIDKSALVAEINKLTRENELYLSENESDAVRFQKTGAYSVLCDLRHFLDNLEMKEVDFEKYYHDFLQKEWYGKSQVRTVSEMMAFTAKHFYELGLSVSNESQKGEVKIQK